MKTFINQHRFIKAVEYANAHFFSKPYSITPVVDRWFNQLAMIEFANGSIVHLSEDVAKKYVDIKRADGTVVDKADIALIFKYFSKHSEYEKEDERLADVISKSKRKLDALSVTPESKEKNKKQIKALEKVVLETQHKIDAINQEQDQAEALFEDLASTDEEGNPRGQWVLNVKRIEKAYKSTIKNMVYRPNHGITHSVRAAYSVPELVAYNQKYSSQSNRLADADIEKLQLMMLFSVVGRRDETGFNDTGRNDTCGNGCETYAGFRETSGMEYLKYCQGNASDLYPNGLESIYRDAIVVEWMGYSSIDDAMARGNIPGVFIDYVIQKKHLEGSDITEDEALLLIKNQQYNLSDLFPSGTEIRTKADVMLGLMNNAHALDLSRCYPLFPIRKGGPAIIDDMKNHLLKVGFLDFSSVPDPEKLTDFFQLRRCSFNALALTGQNTTFGMISADEFAVKKDGILSEVSRISEGFRTTDPEELKTLLQAAKKAKASEDIADYFTGPKNASDAALLASYRTHLIVHAIAVQLRQAPKLNPTVKMFDLNAVVDGQPFAVDHHQTAVNLVNALQTATPFPGIVRTALPIVSAVQHQRALNRITLFFDEEAQAQQFLQAYTATFNSRPITEITLNEKNQFVVDVNRIHYKQLVRDKQLEFKRVMIPAAVNREETLVDVNGNIDALNLIEQSRGLVRLVSTTPLDGKTHPDYDYFFRALDDPMHERYTAPFRDKGTWRADRTHYQDPSNGAWEKRVQRQKIRFIPKNWLIHCCPRMEKWCLSQAIWRRRINIFRLGFCLILSRPI